MLLPFSEYFIIEYRRYCAYYKSTVKDRYDGIIIWHINSEVNTNGSYKNSTNYIKPVYKNGGFFDSYFSDSDIVYIMPNDMYLKDDIWSSSTTPSSDFYNGYKTGAYLKVTGMGEEKATIEVGFQDMGWEQPTVSVTGKNEYSDNYGRVCFTLSYDNVYSMMGNMPTDNIGGKYLSRETIDKYIDIETTGNIQAQIDYENCLLNNKNQAVIWVKGIDKDAIEGEGTVQLILKEGSAINGFKKCESAESPIVEISELDKTPPKVLDVTYFPPWRTRGKVIAFITADEEITTPEVVFTANKNLATSVYDLAGNRTSLQLKVNWISTFWDEDYKTLLPEGILRYSTQEATNQDVTVRLEPLEDVKESSEELIHTFEDNGEYTFTFTDKYGNVNTKTAVVDWIDKEPPEIVLNGESQITLVKGDSYTERGAVATDNRDGTVDVTINGDVDTSQIGTYYVRYSAVDSLGNKGEVTRTVIVLENEYRIIFKNYNGDILQNQNVRTNTMPEYTGETPVKSSDEKYTYTFSGWSPQITAVSDEAEYTAQFTSAPRVYNITLKAKGGTVENSVTEYTYGTGTALPIPTRTGYIFNGWYDNETYSGAVVTEISATDTGDKAYYAKWTPNIYTVTYDYNEATGGNSVKTKTVVYDSEYGTLPTPSKIGCIFNGWSTADNIKVTSETLVSIAENHTLRAQWTDCTHTWDSGKITKNATCTATGTALFTCTVCADTKIEDVAMLPHTEVTDSRIEPTCTESGKTEGKHCSVCGTVIKAQETIPALGHKPVTDKAIPATCTETGKTEGSHCSVCGEVITEQRIIPATGHTSIEIEWEFDDYEHWHKCLVCEERLDKAQHIKDSGTIIEMPTVDKAGIKEYKCAVCDKVIAQEEIPKLEPTPEPSDRVEFTKRANGAVLADIIFEKTAPPKSEDIVLYIAYYKDNRLVRVETPNITEMSALFKIDEVLKDCDIKSFVWDKNMKPLMNVQKINNI